MKKELIKDGSFTYAKIPEEEFKKLNEISFDDMFISYEQISEVQGILGIDINDDIEYIRAIRNSIVRYYGDKASKYYNENTHDFENHKKYQVRLSAITCALDVFLEA